MAFRISALALLVACVGSLRAEKIQTENFIVDAPTREMAKEFGVLAEKYRKEKAIEWLGKEMPNWRTPCPLRIIPAQQGADGATTFNFAQDTRKMFIRGPIERLKNSVLPHEITHTVFAHHFQQPVPRWADEGGSVYSEDDLERRRHDKMVVQYLNAGKAFTLGRLFTMADYPDDPREQMILYAEGFSISKFLIEGSDRQTFINFVADGMRGNWNKAVQRHYQFANVSELEEAWLKHLHMVARGEATTPGDLTARRDGAGNNDRRVATATSSDRSRQVTRESGLPQPELDPLPVARGKAPAKDDYDRKEAGWNERSNRFFEEAPAKFPPSPEANRPAAPPVCKDGSCVAKCPNGTCPTGKCNCSKGPVVLLPPE